MPEIGGYDGALLEELLLARAPESTIREEGYTVEEAIRATVASSLRSTSVTVSIGSDEPAKHSRSAIGQPRRGEAAGITSDGLHGASARSTGTTVAPRGGIAGHSRVKPRSRPD